MKIPEWVIWIDTWEVYINWNQAIGACNTIQKEDGWLSVLNISQVWEDISIKCWHILEWNICWYLTHIRSKDTLCPLAQVSKIIVLDRQSFAA